jgi:hypothetical protein
MFQDKYVFAQLTAFLNRTQFNNYVRKYDGNRYVKHFTCWNQLLAMMFGQLSNRESLRDLIVAFEAHRAKQYHLGLGREPIAKTTLASANQNRDYRIFEDFAFYMMKEACEKRTTNILDIPGKKYASIDDFTRVAFLGVLPHFFIPLHSKYFFTALHFLLECTLKITRPKQTVSDATQFIS